MWVNGCMVTFDPFLPSPTFHRNASRLASCHLWLPHVTRPTNEAQLTAFHQHVLWRCSLFNQLGVSHNACCIFKSKSRWINIGNKAYDKLCKGKGQWSWDCCFSCLSTIIHVMHRFCNDIDTAGYSSCNKTPDLSRFHMWASVWIGWHGKNPVLVQ